MSDKDVMASIRNIMDEVDTGKQPTPAEPNVQPDVQAPDQPGVTLEQVTNGIPADVLEQTGNTPEPPPEPEPTERDAVLKEIEEYDEVPKNDKAGAYWKALKSEVTALKTELEEARASQNKADPDEVNKLKSEIDEMRNYYENEMGKRDITKTRAFYDKYDGKLNTILGRSVKTMMQHGGLSEEDAKAVAQRAFVMNFQQRQRYLMDEVPELHSVIANMYLQADDIKTERQEAIENWRETQAALKETEVRTQKSQSVKQLDQTLSSVTEELANLGNEYYIKSKGTSPQSVQWNQAVDERLLGVKRILLEGDQTELARYVADGMTTRMTREAQSRLRQENSALKQEIQQLKAAKPKVNATRPLAAQPRNNETEERMSVDDRLKAVVFG